MPTDWSANHGNARERDMEMDHAQQLRDWPVEQGPYYEDSVDRALTEEEMLAFSDRAEGEQWQILDPETMSARALTEAELTAFADKVGASEGVARVRPPVGDLPAPAETDPADYERAVRDESGVESRVVPVSGLPAADGPPADAWDLPVAAKASPLILVPWTPPHPLVPFKAQAFFQARLQFAQRLQQQQALVDEAAAAERAAALEQNVIAPPAPVRSIAPAAAR